MWITMNNLEDPFVEYYPFTDSEVVPIYMVQKAINYTYEVPQKW